MNAASLPPRRTQRILAGWMTRDLFDAYLRECDGPRPAHIEDAFERTRAAVAALPSMAAPEAPKPLDAPAEVAHLAPLLAQEQYQDAEFCRVPIDSLTTFQPFLQAQPSATPTTPEGILEWCLPQEPAQGAWDVKIERPGRFYLTQRDPLPQWAPPFEVEWAGGYPGVLFTLQPNVNLVVVGEAWPGRYVVLNGVHRIAALAAAGERTVPALFEPNAREHLRRGDRWFPEGVLRSPRPPLVKDFLEPSVSLDLPVREKRARFMVEWRMTPIIEPMPDPSE